MLPATLALAHDRGRRAGGLARVLAMLEQEHARVARLVAHDEAQLPWLARLRDAGQLHPDDRETGARAVDAVGHGRACRLGRLRGAERPGPEILEEARGL